MWNIFFWMLSNLSSSSDLCFGCFLTSSSSSDLFLLYDFFTVLLRSVFFKRKYEEWGGSADTSCHLMYGTYPVFPQLFLIFSFFFFRKIRQGFLFSEFASLFLFSFSHFLILFVTPYVWHQSCLPTASPHFLIFSLICFLNFDLFWHIMYGTSPVYQELFLISWFVPLFVS